MNPEKPLDRLRKLFEAAGNNDGWEELFNPTRTSIVRAVVVEKCGFSRSTIYQNSGVKNLIAETELELIRSGLLCVRSLAVGKIPDLPVPDDLSSRLLRAEQRIGELRQKIESVRSSVERILAGTV